MKFCNYFQSTACLLGHMLSQVHIPIGDFQGKLFSATFSLVCVHLTAINYTTICDGYSHKY